MFIAYAISSISGRIDFEMKNSGKYENNLNIIGPLLREKIKEKKLSFEQLSNKLLLLGINIPVTCLHRIENNQRTVRDYELCALSIALDIDIQELLTPFINNLKDSEQM